MSTSCNPFVGTSCCKLSCRVLAQILAAVLLDRSCLHIQSYPWLSPIHCCLFQPLHSSHLQWLRYPSSVCRPALFPGLRRIVPPVRLYRSTCRLQCLCCFALYQQRYSSRVSICCWKSSKTQTFLFDIWRRRLGCFQLYSTVSSMYSTRYKH